MTRPVYLLLLFTGGQDSLLAAALLRAQGCELAGLYVETLTGCGQRAARERAAEISLPLEVVPAGDADVERLRQAWGHSDRLSNPCATCRVALLGHAAGRLDVTGADGIATGEVLGQRAGQGRMELLAAAAAAGLQDRVLRPLSARLLPPTQLEQDARIDRERLGDLNGRGRKRQQAIAARLGLGPLPAPGEDCPLLNAEFAQRSGDLLNCPLVPPAEFALLRLGRHFRVSPGAKVIVGRDASENAALEEWLAQASLPNGHAVLVRPAKPGPTALLVGSAPHADEAFRFAAGLIARFARWPMDQPMEVLAGSELRSLVPDPAAWQAAPIGSGK